MSARKPEKAKGKSGRKRLTLSKKTLKDLTSKNDLLKGGGRNELPAGKGYTEFGGCSF